MDKPEDLVENQVIRCFKKDHYHKLVQYLKQNDLLDNNVDPDPPIATVISTVFHPYGKEMLTAKYAQRYNFKIIDFKNIKI